MKENHTPITRANTMALTLRKSTAITKYTNLKSVELRNSGDVPSAGLAHFG
jgi:hypothetical protein